MNPADEATRNSCSKSESTWFTGPAFLNTNDEAWPEQHTIAETLKERRICNIQETRSTITLYTDWCSDWTRLKRAVCYWIKYVEKLTAKVRKTQYSDTITADHFKRAELLLLLQTQREKFPKELINLMNGEKVEHGSPISDHELELDEEGLIRITGRIKNMRQIILPKNSSLEPPYVDPPIDFTTPRGIFVLVSESLRDKPPLIPKLAIDCGACLTNTTIYS